MNTNANEPWMETLQGRSPATDRETLEAQGMRRYFEARLESDLEPLIDTARERRLRNLVEAHLAAEAQATARTTAKPSNPLITWLQNWNLGWPAMGAATAAVVLGVLMGPLMQSQNSVDDEWAAPKALPSEQPGTASPGVLTPKSFDPNAATNPQEFANQVRAALSPMGVEINLETAADGMRLSANIPTEQRGAAAQALKPLGLELPADGRLRVLIR